MTGKSVGLLLGLCLLGCHGSRPNGAKADDAEPAAGVAGLSKTPDTAVIKRHCAAGPDPVALSAMKDSAGYIGGYIFKRLILDSPVHFLDPKGDEVAMFHIFSPPEERRRNTPIIDALRAAYPIEAPLECPPTAGK